MTRPELIDLPAQRPLLRAETGSPVALCRVYGEPAAVEPAAEPPAVAGVASSGSRSGDVDGAVLIDGQPAGGVQPVEVTAGVGEVGAESASRLL
jgi:hypothetical protein